MFAVYVFRHDEETQCKPLNDRPSIYYTLDELWRKRSKLEDLPPLEVMLWDGKLRSLCNRRLTILKMLQGVSQRTKTWHKKIHSRYPVRKSIQLLRLKMS